VAPPTGRKTRSGSFAGTLSCARFPRSTGSGCIRGEPDRDSVDTVRSVPIVGFGLSALGWDDSGATAPVSGAQVQGSRVWDLTSWDEYELQDAEGRDSAALPGSSFVSYVAAEAPRLGGRIRPPSRTPFMTHTHVPDSLARAPGRRRACGLLTVPGWTARSAARPQLASLAAFSAACREWSRRSLRAPEDVRRELEFAPDVDAREEQAGLSHRGSRLTTSRGAA